MDSMSTLSVTHMLPKISREVNTHCMETATDRQSDDEDSLTGSRGRVTTVGGQLLRNEIISKI